MASKLKWVAPVVVLTVIIAAGTIAALILLSPDRGTLYLECRKAIDLSIDGNQSGSGTVFSLPLTTGSHEYKGIIKGLAGTQMTVEGTFDIKKGQETKVLCGEDPKISFKSTPPGADVSLEADNVQSLGKTPVDVNLPPGTYTFIVNLGGQAKKHGPFEIKFDETKKIEAFFGRTPKTGSTTSDSMIISSTPEGVQIFKDEELVGITPVSFERIERLYAKSGTTTIELPAVFLKQHVWLHPGDDFEMAVSQSPIGSSEHEWFATGGYYKAFIEDGFLKITNNAGQIVQSKLPPHDRICDLSLNGSQMVFTGISSDKLIVSGYEANVAKPSEVKQIERYVSEFARSVQSQDGSTTRYFGYLDGNLTEFDIAEMKVYKLGKTTQGLHYRRMGETSDFAIGAFSPDGTCTGIYGRRFAYEMDSPYIPGFTKDVQPAVMVFFNSDRLIGFNTGSGEVEWQTTLQEPLLQVIWNNDEQVWVGESLDSERFYHIDPSKGNPIPIEKGSGFVQENPFPGFRSVGIANMLNGYAQILFKPSGVIKAVANGVEVWSITCDTVFSTKAFNPLTDIGNIYIRSGSKLSHVNLETGAATHVSTTQPIDFFENGAVLFPDGICSGANKIFYGQSSATRKGNALKITLPDRSTCLILP